MRLPVWRPPVEPSPTEQTVMRLVRRAKLFVWLRLHRHQLLDKDFQAELAAAWKQSPKGQPSVAPAQLALATILQAYTGAEQIRDDLAAQEATLAELHIDRAYLSSTLVRDRPDDLEIFCKAWRVRNDPRFAKTDFTLDFDHGAVGLPAGQQLPFTPGLPMATVYGCRSTLRRTSPIVPIAPKASRSSSRQSRPLRCHSAVTILSAALCKKVTTAVGTPDRRFHEPTRPRSLLSPLLRAPGW